MRVRHLYRMYRTCGLLAALAWQSCVGSAADAASGYTVVGFGALPEGKSQIVRALSKGGAVGTRAFALNTARVEIFDGRPDTDCSAAHGINDLDKVVGSANTATRGRSPDGGNHEPRFKGAWPCGRRAR